MFGFASHLRLNQAADFRRLFRLAKKNNTPYFGLYSYANQLPYARLGLVISKKAARLACQRNQIKRIMRESFRLNQQGLAGFDIMIVAYKGINALNKQDLRVHLEKGWLKLISLAEKNKNDELGE